MSTLRSKLDVHTIYSIEDMKTMLKVISTKFSRVLTFQLLAPSTSKYFKCSNKFLMQTKKLIHFCLFSIISVYYVANETYYQTISEVFTAEAAALVNREGNVNNTRPNLSVYIGLHLYLDNNRMQTEISLAFESVRKSHSIYPGTTKGIRLSHPNIATNLTIANLALLKAQEMKGDAKLVSVLVVTISKIFLTHLKTCSILWQT